MPSENRLSVRLLVPVFLLIGAGLLCLWSVAPPWDMSGKGILNSVLVRQAMFAAGGIVLMLLVSIPHYWNARRFAYVFYGLCLVALVALLILAKPVKGARGWFTLGPIRLQPAEFMKLALVLALARWLAYEERLTSWRGLLGPVILTLVPTGLILVQPDLGGAMLFVPILMAMLYTAGARRRHLGILVLSMMLSVPMAYGFLRPYQRARLDAFLTPRKVSKDQNYQQEQSVQAMGAGGWFGRGIGESAESQPLHVPERRTDFVFSIIGEEMGFAGSILVLALFLLFFAECLGVAFVSRDPFGRLAVVGVMTFMVLQMVINVGMTLGVAPITGLTLPFLSYGGSSLLVCCLATGLILNVGSHWVPVFSSHGLAESREIREIPSMLR